MSQTAVAPRAHHHDGAPAVKGVLGELLAALPDAHGCLVASVDGLPIAADLRGGDPAGLAAMAATAAGLANRIVAELELGDFAESVVRAGDGYFVVYDVGRTAVLAVLAGDAANLGRIHIQARRVIPAISDLLA